MRSSWAAGLCLPLLLAASTQAAVYRWVDQDGQIHFSDMPPPGGAEELKMPAPAPRTAVPNDDERATQRQRLLDVYERERLERANAREKQRAEQALASKRCTEAKALLRDYEQHPLLYELQPDGSRRYLGDLERDKEIERMRAQVKRWCRSG